MNPCGISKRQELKNLRESEKEQTLDEKAEIIGKFEVVMFKMDKWWNKNADKEWDAQKAYLTKAFVKAGLLPKELVTFFWFMVDTIELNWPKMTKWGDPKWEATVALMKHLLVDMRINAYGN